jgi:hypothetical protein
MFHCVVFRVRLGVTRALHFHLQLRIALHQRETRGADLSGCSADCSDKVTAVSFTDKEMFFLHHPRRKAWQAVYKQLKVYVCMNYWCRIIAISKSI